MFKLPKRYGYEFLRGLAESVSIIFNMSLEMGWKQGNAVSIPRKAGCQGCRSFGNPSGLYWNRKLGVFA